MQKFLARPKCPVLTLTVVAAAELEGCRAIGLDGNYVASAAAMHGVSATNAYAGDELAVDVLGTTVAEAGAAIAAGALVQVGSDGKFITKAAGKTVGRALEAATADGSVFEMLLLPANA